MDVENPMVYVCSLFILVCDEEVKVDVGAKDHHDGVTQSFTCVAVFSQGDKGTSWYIIWKGSVNVITHGKVSTSRIFCPIDPRRGRGPGAPCLRSPTR